MTVSNIKVKVIRKPTLKLKVLPRFPSNFTVTAPLLLDRSGGGYAASIDLNALLSFLGPLFTGNLTGAVTSLGLATSLGSFTSANLRAALTDEVGTGAAYFVGGALGTPASGTATNLTGTASGLTAGNVTTNANLTGAVTSIGNAASLGSFSSANLAAALSDETGSGSAVFGTSPIISTADARGIWTTGTSWTLPAFTLGGAVSGGGNQVNNVIIGNSTPLAGSFTNVSATGSILSGSPSAGVGYKTGAGGTVTQITSKSTGVTLNTLSGGITMNNAALAAATIVSFVVTDTSVANTDVIIVNHLGGGTPGAYTINARVGVGSFAIDVRNNTAGSLSEALQISFAVIKGANS